MIAKTWVPGTDTELDQLFDALREKQYNDQSHRLWQNYSQHMLSFSVACTIVFDDSQTPLVCSTIGSRKIWPAGVYRIFNRTWKPVQRKSYITQVTPGMGLVAQSQIAWLADNTDCKLYFISREKDNWADWMIRDFSTLYGVEFSKDNHKYLTCDNECDCSCWQHIIYNGDHEILTQWKHQ